MPRFDKPTPIPKRTANHRRSDLRRPAQAVDPFPNGGEVGQGSAQPALVHVVHSTASGGLDDGLLGLPLRADEQDATAAGGQIRDEGESLS